MTQDLCPVTKECWFRTMKEADTPVLSIAIQRPAFPRMKNNRRLERYFTTLVQCWKSRWENELFQKAVNAFSQKTSRQPFLPWKAELNFDVTFWAYPIISLRIKIQEQTNIEPSPYILLGEVWDYSTGYPCSLRDILHKTAHRHIRELIIPVQNQAKQRMTSDDSLLDPNCISSLKKHFDSNRFFLAEDGIKLFYPLYTLGPYSEGIPEFTISFVDKTQ